MAITIGGVTTGQTNGGVSTVTSTGVTTQSASTIIVGCVWDGASTTFNTISDSNSNSWTQLGTEATVSSSLNAKCRWYYAQNVTGGSGHTFTFTTTGTASLTILAIELRGVPTSGVLDLFVTGTTDTSSPFTADITPTSGNRTLVAIYFGDGTTNAPVVGGSWTTPSGGALAGDANSWGVGSGTIDVTANGSTAYTASFTENAATSGVVGVAAFIPAVVGPTIDVQPQSVTAVYGSTASFSVSATSSGGSLSYQWEYSKTGGASWLTLTGATSSTYTTGTLTFTENGYLYRVKVTDSNGTTTSDSALLTVPTPAITVQPANQTFGTGDTATFSVTAITNSGSLAYQWFLQSVPGEGFAQISGATSSSYTTGTLSNSDAGKGYLVLVTDSGTPGAVYSNPAYLQLIQVSPSTSSAPFDPNVFDGAAFDVVTPSPPSATRINLTGKQPTITQGAAGTTISPTVGHLTLTGRQPSVLLTTVLTPTVDNLLLTGRQPTVTQVTYVAPSVGHLTLTGYSPAIVQASGISPSVGHLVLTGRQPTIQLDAVLAPAVGHLTLTGRQPTIFQGTPVTVSPQTGHLTLTGRQVTLYKLYPEPDQVLAGVQYGPSGSFTGTYTPTAGGTRPIFVFDD